MTITEALDLALKTLREKADIERIQLHMVDRAPAIARQIDPHATIRYHKYLSAIELLNGLKQHVKSSSPLQGEGREGVESPLLPEAQS